MSLFFTMPVQCSVQPSARTAFKTERVRPVMKVQCLCKRPRIRCGMTRKIQHVTNGRGYRFLMLKLSSDFVPTDLFPPHLLKVYSPPWASLQFRTFHAPVFSLARPMSQSYQSNLAAPIATAQANSWVPQLRLGHRLYRFLFSLLAHYVSGWVLKCWRSCRAFSSDFFCSSRDFSYLLQWSETGIFRTVCFGPNNLCLRRMEQSERCIIYASFHLNRSISIVPSRFSLVTSSHLCLVSKRCSLMAFTSAIMQHVRLAILRH